MYETIRRVCGRQITFLHHDRLHFDEGTAIWLIERKATREWLNAHCPGDRVMIGCGDGEFDDHTTATKVRTGTDSSATLVAQSLGLRKHPAYRQLFNYVVAHDQQGVTNPFDAGGIVKMLHSRFPSAQVLEWIYMVLDAEYTKQQEYLQAPAIVKEAKVRMVTIGKRQLKVVAVSSGNRQVIKAFRTPSISGAVCVQAFPTGHIRVFIDRFSGVDMRVVAREIRKTEIAARSLDVQIDDDLLTAEGWAGLEDPKVWYFVHGMMLNGSNTEPDADPTKLTLEQVTDIVADNLALKSLDADVVSNDQPVEGEATG